jgi:hypothetical protein
LDFLLVFFVVFFVVFLAAFLAAFAMASYLLSITVNLGLPKNIVNAFSSRGADFLLIFPPRRAARSGRRGAGARCESSAPAGRFVRAAPAPRPGRLRRSGAPRGSKVFFRRVSSPRRANESRALHSRRPPRLPRGPSTR